MTPRERTEEKLQGVHPDLVAVVRLPAGLGRGLAEFEGWPAF